MRSRSFTPRLARNRALPARLHSLAVIYFSLARSLSWTRPAPRAARAGTRSRVRPSPQNVAANRLKVIMLSRSTQTPTARTGAFVAGSRARGEPRRAAPRERANVDRFVLDRRAIALSMFALSLSRPLNARADDDGSFSSKVNAKDARKAEILAAARAKAQAQAQAAPMASSKTPAPTSAAMFITEDPGRGGGAGAPNIAPRSAQEE